MLNTENSPSQMSKRNIWQWLARKKNKPEKNIKGPKKKIIFLTKLTADNSIEVNNRIMHKEDTGEKEATEEDASEEDKQRLS